MREFMNIIAENEQQFYVRFGDIPEGGRSKIGAAPNYLKAMMQKDTHEVGVSVYPIEWSEEMNRWAIDCNNPASLDGLLAQRRPAYMVTGEPAEDADGYDAYGMDDEPLITNVKIVRELPYNTLWYPGWGKDPMPEEYLD